MSEITKLYENAGVKICKRKQGFTLKDCTDRDCRECGYNDISPFTAEKQLRLIRLLLQRKNGYKFSFSLINDNSEYLFFAHKDNTPVQELIVTGDKCYKETLASFINTLWQDLTEEEKQQVKGILE